MCVQPTPEQHKFLAFFVKTIFLASYQSQTIIAKCLFKITLINGFSMEQREQLHQDPRKKLCKSDSHLSKKLVFSIYCGNTITA